MLTPRENFLETVRGGQPDRYSNQFEALALQWCSPQDIRHPDAEYGKGLARNCWGVYFNWPKGTPGAFPVQDAEHILIKDIEHWKDYVQMPETIFPEEEWVWIVEEAGKVDRTQQFVTAVQWPGIFENCHHMMDIEECMVNFYEEPEIMHEIIEMITEYEIRMAKEIIEHIHPDALYRHDDWGSQKSTFMSNQMFREFLLEPTKKIYSFWKENGVEVIIHHSDAYGESMIPEMIECGIDVWQGALSTNDLNKIAKEYKGKLTVMGGINNGIVDREDWTKEKVIKEVNRVLDWTASPYIIPNTTFGGDISTYDGVYQTVTDAIDEYNKTKYKNW